MSLKLREEIQVEDKNVGVTGRQDITNTISFSICSYYTEFNCQQIPITSVTGGTYLILEVSEM